MKKKCCIVYIHMHNTVMAKNFHELVKNVYIMTVFSSNYFCSSCVCDRMSGTTHTTLPQKTFIKFCLVINLL